MTAFRAERWRPTLAFAVAVAAALTALVVAVLARRPDLVVLATGFAVGLAAPLLRRSPGALDVLELRLPRTGIWEGDLGRAEIIVGTDGPVDLALVAVAHAMGVEIEHPGSLQAVVVRPGQPRTVALPIRALRWGRPGVGPVTVTLTAAHGLLRRDSAQRVAGSVAVVPLREVFDATDLVPRASGLVGGHRSREPGSGTDLHTIRPFAPGDRLRRITWPVSLRTGTLHVTTTTEDRDTDVVLIVDSALDIGDRAAPSGSSLDITVRAAASVAEHYLRRGDRVGLIDLGTLRRPVRLGAGRRHMLQVLAGLLNTENATKVGTETMIRRLRDVPPRAMVMFFSSLLDEQVGARIAMLARGGHPVLVVDTLPPDVRIPEPNEWTPLAWELALLHRDTLQRRLAEFGVPVVRWQGAGSLDQVLALLTRAASMPRPRR